MSASTVQSLVETAAKCSADNITKIGYNALIGIDTESYWKDHTMQRWPRRYSYNSQWFQKGFEGVDPMTEDDSYWREKYVQGHCIDALRSLVLSKANVDSEILRKIFYMPLSVEVCGRKASFSSVSPEILLRRGPPPELDYLLIRDGKLFDFFVEFPSILEFLQNHLRRLGIYHCVGHADTLYRTVESLIRDGILESLEILDCALDEGSMLKLVRLFSNDQSEAKCDCSKEQLQHHWAEGEPDLYDMALIGSSVGEHHCCKLSDENYFDKLKSSDSEPVSNHKVLPSTHGTVVQTADEQTLQSGEHEQQAMLSPETRAMETAVTLQTELPQEFLLTGDTTKHLVDSVRATPLTATISRDSDFSNFSGLQCILLENIRISDRVASALGYQLKHWKNLKKCAFRSCGFEVDGLATILQGILERDEVNKLKHVEISDTPSLPRDHLIELVKLCIRCDNCQLQTLRFENLGLTTYPSLDQQPRLFSEKTFSNFTTPFELTCYLNLSGINLGYREDVASLCYLIRNDAALRHLILSDCYLSPDNLNAIFHAVQDAGRLQSLDVSANHYDGDDDGQLVDMLNESGVQRLNLNACHLRGQFSSGLIQALKNNRKLKMLWIAENRLGDDGLDKLSPVFAGEDSLSQIEILDISCNCISVEPLLKFTSSLKSTSKKITLREVSVFGNWFGEDQDMVSFIHKQLSEMIETVRTSTLYQSTFSSVTAEHISQM
ncbi:uncharacterized protein [Ptychodera flava]|uniref:uncharacterized protein isoform X2 n=1 Tax=Ptychodera flava TaxID=63121 RepID=UPI00396A97E0